MIARAMGTVDITNNKSDEKINVFLRILSTLWLSWIINLKLSQPTNWESARLTPGIYLKNAIAHPHNGTYENKITKIKKGNAKRVSLRPFFFIFFPKIVTITEAPKQDYVIHLLVIN